MSVSGGLWALTLAGLLTIITVDLVITERQQTRLTTRSAAIWVTVYILLAAGFAGFLAAEFGGESAAQFAAGYITEYSLSIDNLFVFMVIMTSFAVPQLLQHRVLLVGIVIALVLRGILIVVGAGLIARFGWILLIFGLFLLYTALKVWGARPGEVDPTGNALVRFVSRRVPVSPEYDGTRLTTTLAGRRALTPLALVMIAIGTTDLLFAVDSIPAVLGITTEAYLVFAANAFALLGLRQLYFLMHGLLGRLKYLNRGLALILLFIGVKLLLEAGHGAFGLPLPEVPTWFSLLVIVVILGTTTALSLRVREDPPNSPPG